MSTIDLTKTLVSIPSFLGPGSNEEKIGQFIFEYLSNFKWLEVNKQRVENGRFNVVAKDKFRTKVLFCGHMDTVEPKSQFRKPTIKDNKLYGLGSSDMKCTLASMLSAIGQIGPTNGVMWLFYIDEEYDFLGMNKFIEEYKGEIKPKLIIGEGSDNKIRNGCRGLIEIKFSVLGKTGHASRPENGINAIIGAQKIYRRISETVNKYTDKFVGNSSINLASVDGGLNLGGGKIGRQGNNIADYCEFIIDVRTATNKLRARNLVQTAEKEALRNGLEISAVVRHDKLGWFSPFAKLPKKIINKYKIWSDFRTGYVDTQMLNETFNCPCYGFGCGLDDQAHKTNEYVAIKNLVNPEYFYMDLIKSLEGGEKL